MKKNKKTIFIILGVVLVGIIGIFLFGGNSKLDWDSLALGEHLPNPNKKGEIGSNLDDYLTQKAEINEKPKTIISENITKIAQANSEFKLNVNKFIESLSIEDKNFVKRIFVMFLYKRVLKIFTKMVKK